MTQKKRMHSQPNNGAVNVRTKTSSKPEPKQETKQPSQIQNNNFLQKIYKPNCHNIPQLCSAEQDKSSAFAIFSQKQHIQSSHNPIQSANNPTSINHSISSKSNDVNLNKNILLLSKNGQSYITSNLNNKKRKSIETAISNTNQFIPVATNDVPITATSLLPTKITTASNIVIKPVNELNNLLGNLCGPGEFRNRLKLLNTCNEKQHSNIIEREFRLQKSLSEECEDLGVDEPSTSELFPEAELLFDSGSSAFDIFNQETTTNSNDILKQRVLMQNNNNNNDNSNTSVIIPQFYSPCSSSQPSSALVDHESNSSNSTNPPYILVKKKNQLQDANFTDVQNISGTHTTNQNYLLKPSVNEEQHHNSISQSANTIQCHFDGPNSSAAFDIIKKPLYYNIATKFDETESANATTTSKRNKIRKRSMTSNHLNILEKLKKKRLKSNLITTKHTVLNQVSFKVGRTPPPIEVRNEHRISSKNISFNLKKERYNNNLLLEKPTHKSTNFENSKFKEDTINTLKNANQTVIKTNDTSMCIRKRKASSRPISKNVNTSQSNKSLINYKVKSITTPVINNPSKRYCVASPVKITSNEDHLFTSYADNSPYIVQNYGTDSNNSYNSVDSKGNNCTGGDGDISGPTGDSFDRNNINIGCINNLTNNAGTQS